MIGQTLGNYRIIEQIGLGGMATVYKGYDPATDRYVAIKVLSQQLSQNPQFRQRFEREARAIARLEHIHILPIFSYGEENGIAYMAMRYLQAGTLTERLARGSLTLTEASQILSQIASALEYAHSNGILHRDVKPSNVLLDASENCFLTDFGIAKMVEATTDLTGDSILGTPAYMSPEQCQGMRKLTPASDIYSLGIILYEMVTGRRPFDAETPLAVLYKHLNDPLPPPRTLQPGLPPAAENVVFKALAKNPADRYQTAGEMAAAFTRALQGIGDFAPSPVIPTMPASLPASQPLQASSTAQATEIAPPPLPTTTASRRKLPGWVWGLIGLILIGLVVVAVVLGKGLLPSRPAVTEVEPTAVAPGTGDEPSSGMPTTLFMAEGKLGKTLFGDTLDKPPSSEWILVGEWAVESQSSRTVWHGRPDGDGRSAAELPQRGWTDYALQYDVKFASFDSPYMYTRVRMIPCAPGVQANDNYIFTLSPQLMELNKETCAAQGWTILASEPALLETTGWHTVQINLIGNRVQVIVDGRSVFDVVDPDSPLTKGGVVIETERENELLLDNVSVVELIPGSGGEMLLPTPGPAVESSATQIPPAENPQPSTLPAGTQQFVPADQYLGTAGAYAVALGDLDGDLDVDAIVGAEVWLNDGAGRFAVFSTLPEAADRMILGDLDGDGDPDMVAANQGTRPNQVWLNDGSGQFGETGTGLGTANSWSGDIGDVDGDGDLDVVLGTWTDRELWLNDGHANMSPAPQDLGLGQTRALALHDLDLDGDLDLFTVGPALCQVWRNDGAGAFAPQGSGICFTNMVSLAVGDLDGDGYPDAYIGHGGSEPDQVWLNNGRGILMDSGQRNGATSSEAVALADVDQDGDLDVITSDTPSEGLGLQVWLNDGAGVMTADERLGSDDTFMLAAGDVNADGLLDLIAGNTGHNRLWLQR